MALPASYPISLLQVYSEYGAPVGTPMTSLVRSGAYVGNTAPNAGIPTAPPINLGQFRGGQGVSALAAGKTGDAAGTVFNPEPAPATAAVSTNNVTILASGGSGSYTYNWAYLSGDAGIAIGGGTTGATKSWSKTVNKNASTSATWRCTVSDGVSSVQVNVTISLSYSSDL